MPTQDTSQIKEKIISILKVKGPSLPVHIANQTGLSILFSSAFLSELFAEKRIKISNMKVGSSPLYFLPGQEPQLERFSQHLKSKEKDAFLLLKEKKFLKDSEQEPAIRVALRAIRDFAIPFKKEEDIFWRYFTVPEMQFEYEKDSSEKKELKEEKPKKEEEITENHEEKSLNIFNEKKPKKRKIKKKTEKKTNEKFFNKVKEFLSEKSVEIIDIESYSKNELILKIKENEAEKLLIAYNKKRITEEDIIKAHKKSQDLGLKYKILSLGELTKKIKELIEALKEIEGIEKISFIQ